MKDFDLRKYMSNNPLHQSNIGGFSITELQQTSKSDFEIGLAILNEMGYDFSEELLTEIKIKDLLSKAGSSIKNSVKALAFNKSLSKDGKKDFNKKLALLKKLSPSKEIYNKFLDLLKSGKKVTVSDLTKLASPSSKKQIDEKWLTNISDGARKTFAWIALGMYLVGFAQNLDYTSIQIDDANQTTSAISVGDIGSSIIGNDGATINFGDVAPELGDIVDDNAEEDIKDIADEDIDDDLVNDFGKYLASSVDDGGFEFWMDNGVGDVDDADIQMLIDQSIELLKSKFPNLKKITLTDNATWTNTQGDDASDDKALDGGSVSKDRQNSSNKINKLLKKAIEDNFEDVDVTHVEKDAVKDSSKEFEAGSLEARVAQKVGSTWSDIDPGDNKDITPDDTDDSGDDNTKTTSPKDVIAFLSKKPEFDKSKYEIIFMHILPFIIGNGEDGITKSNPAFEKILKTLNFSDKSETLNDTFIAKRLGRPEIKNKKTGKISKAIPSELKGRLKNAKGDEKKDIEDTIKVLTWLRSTKKSPKTIGDFLNKLNPNLEVGEKRKFGKQDTRLKKGEKVTPSKSRKDFRGPGAKPEKLNNPMNIMPMEYLIKEIRSSLLMEFNSSQLPDYNESAAKKNIGHLLPIYTTSFKGKATDEDDGTITYNIDAIYDFDDKGEPSIKPEYAKSQEYFQKYFKIFPQHKEQAKQVKKEKEDVTVKTDTKTTTTSTTSPKSTDVKVGDTIELDPKVSDKKKTSKNKNLSPSKSGTEDNIQALAKTLSGKGKSKSKSSKGDSETLARKTDYKKGEDAVEPSSKNFGDELGKQKQVVTALNLINTTEELQNLLVGMMKFISPTLLKNPAKLKSTLMRVATTSYDPEGVPDSERVKKEKELKKASKDGEQLKLDLKENLFLFSLFEEAKKETDEVFKDVEKVVDLIKNKPTLLNRLKLIKSYKALEELILAELIEKLNDKFVTKDLNVRTAIKGAAAIAGSGTIEPYDKTKSSSTDKVSPSQAKDISKQLTAEQIKSLIKNIITEGLTPSQASKVKDKYKQIYSGMLKGDKKKLLKYIDDKFGRPNPDAMAMGRAVNLSKKEEDENVEEAKTENQRKYMCVMAQQGAKRPKGLSKAQAKEMCADTGLSKSKQEEQKLSEIDDIMDKSKDYKPIVGGDNSKQRKWAKMTKKEKKKLYPKFYDRRYSELRPHEKDQIKETGKNKSEENMDEYRDKNRLTELIKTALKGPLNEATDLLDRDGYQFTRFSMGKKGPGLQISDKITSRPGGNFIQIPGDRLSDFSKALTDVIRVFDDMERQLPVDEAEFTDKYNDHPGLTGKQKNLPDALQKGILGLEEDNIDEYASLARYDKDGNKTVTTIDDIDILPRHKRLQHEMAFNDFITTLKALGYDIPEGTLPMEENINEGFKDKLKGALVGVLGTLGIQKYGADIFNKVTGAIANALPADKAQEFSDTIQMAVDYLMEVGTMEENIDEDKIPGSNIKKVGDKYRVLSGKTGKMWKQKYDSKKDAEAALRGYFASKNESLSERIFKELRK